MGDYNLSGLNPREFEHLVQALALAVISPGVTPFGDGPDGGREAIFRGRMAYPSVADPWEGYLVIQAKFRQRPAGDPHKDDAWLLDHLKKDLDKFVDPKRKLPRPEYYLLVTNVVLTPVQDSGSKDRALALLAQRQAEIGYRGYSIWDYDHLRSLLDGQEAIRHRYLPFIGTGDVLAEVMRQLQGQQPDFELIVSRFLQVELRTDLYSRLEQAGHTSDDRIPLARVFVDLPAADNRMVDPPMHDDMRARPGPGLLADLLQHASQILKPAGHKILTSNWTSCKQPPQALGHFRKWWRSPRTQDHINSSTGRVRDGNRYVFLPGSWIPMSHYQLGIGVQHD